MKYFLCAFGAIYLGIPQERTKRVISVSDAENRDSFISLPLLLGCDDVTAPHVIILKSQNEERERLLLVPPLDIDLEIPEKDICTVPKVFGGNLRYFRGAYFFEKDHEERMVLILDTEKLLEDYK